MRERENFTVGVDFDRVLFKTDRFNKYLKERTGLYHVEENVYSDKGNYSPRKHAEACGIDPEKVYSEIKNLENFLYDDVDVLEDFEGELLVVTRGEERFQRAKIEASGIKKFVDGVKIIEKGSKDVGIDFLIDDREEEIKRAGVDGFVLDRDENSLEDALEAVRNS